MKLIVFLVLLLVVLWVLVFFLGPRWVSPEMTYLDWANFVEGSILILLLIPTLAFVLYSLFLYRSVRLKEPSDVLRLRRPWIIVMLVAGLVQVIAASALGITMLPHRSFSALVRVVSFALLEGVLAMLVFWLFSFCFVFPKRVRYVPFLSHRWGGKK